ncbi:hypothetical protein P9858_20115 [Niallia circulans]|uniref:hypothetical protein n=1 Tax=Niallia circulans TaxID=1397 RepID=UPI002E1DF4F0|nr:hypothetical protein [Niallia circulans]
MTLNELKLLLNQVGYPVTYSHFTPTKEKPMPSPPYICYLFVDSENFFADDTVYLEGANIDIELYTSVKDLAAEKKLKDVLLANGITFEQNEVYIKEEGLFKNTFEVELR